MLNWLLNTWEILKDVKKVLRNQKRIAKNQLAIYKKLKHVQCLLLDLRNPALVTTITGEKRIDSMDFMIFKVDLPAPAAEDVASRVVTVSIDGGEPVEHVLAGDALVIEDLKGPQDSEVVVTLKDVDDSGNESETVETVVTLLDTIPPGKPGSPVVTVTGETTE